jgi:hypothetical protein
MNKDFEGSGCGLFETGQSHYLSHDSQYSGLGSNWTPPRYKSIERHHYTDLFILFSWMEACEKRKCAILYYMFCRTI